MGKIILSKEQVTDLISANKYPVKDEARFLSRCVDGRYNNSKNLPPLAIPGSDAGQLSLIFATANTYGFEVDKEKVFGVVVDVVGGIKNFNFHSDHHGDLDIPASGCGHIKQQTLNPKAYGLEDDQMEFIKKTLLAAKKKGANETILEGDHQEGAVLQIHGQFSVYPRFLTEAEVGKVQAQAFIFHSSLVDERNKLIAKKLIDHNAVKFLSGGGEEYLYEALSEVTENHLFETLKRLAVGLPIFAVSFETDGSFEIKDLGVV